MKKLLTLQDLCKHMLPKMGKKNEQLKSYKTYEDIIELVCPSETVKQHWRDIGFKFTDAQLAIIINEEVGLCKKIIALQCLRGFASAKVVAKIDAFITYMKKWWEKFQESSDDSCFVIFECDRVWHRHICSEIAGTAKDFSTALKIAQCYDNDYLVEIKKFKYINVSDKKNDWKKYDDGELACIKFNENGYIDYCSGFWNDDDLKQYMKFYNDFYNSFFGFDRFKIPHPFRKGDVVRCIDEFYKERLDNPDGAWAYVNSGPSGDETFDEYEDKCIREWGGDYSDSVITVEIMNKDGEFEHAHISPFYFEKAKDDGSYPYKILEWVGWFCATGHGYVQEIQMLLEAYRELKDKNTKCKV